MPTTVPTIPTTSATVESLSPLFFPITAKTIETGPKIIGNKRKEIPPRTIAIIENVLLD
jgi:hypothetical protein